MASTDKMPAFALSGSFASSSRSARSNAPQVCVTPRPAPARHAARRVVSSSSVSGVRGRKRERHDAEQTRQRPSPGDSSLSKADEQAMTLKHHIDVGEPLPALAAFRSVIETQLPPYVDTKLCNRLLRLLCDAQFVEEAIFVFNAMRSRPSAVKPTVVTYSTLFSRMASRRKKPKRSLVGTPSSSNSVARRDDTVARSSAPQDAENVRYLLKCLTEDKLRPDVVLLNSIISSAAAIGSSKLAWKVFDTFRRQHVTPNIRTLNQLLVAVGADSSTSMLDVKGVMREVKKLQLQPDIFTFSSLCDIAADHGDVRMVCSLLQEMRDASIEPNARTWSSIVRACCNAGDLSRARGFLDELVETSPESVSVHLYTVLIDAYGKAGKLDTAFELLSDMTARGITPNTHTYSSLVHSCGKAGATDVMMELFAAMQRAGVQPNEVTYSSIIYYAGRAGIDWRQSSSLTEHSYNALLARAAEMSRSSQNSPKISSFWSREEMQMRPLAESWPVANAEHAQSSIDPTTDQERDVELDQSHIHETPQAMQEFSQDKEREQALLELLSGFASKSELFQSFLILGEMKRRGMDTKKAYNAVLAVCGRASDFEAAVSAFEAMQSDGITPDSHSYACLVRAMSGEDSWTHDQERLVRVFLVFLEMQSAGVSPDLIFMNGLIEACRQCKAPEKAAEAFASMSQLGLRPDAASYTSWLLACVESNELAQALDVLRDMLAVGFAPSDSTWSSLMTGVAEAGLTSRALDLLLHPKGVASPHGMRALIRGTAASVNAKSHLKKILWRLKRSNVDGFEGDLERAFEALQV